MDPRTLSLRSSVFQSSPTGDTIIAVDGQPINEAKDLSRKIANVAPGKSVSLTLWRQGKERNVTLEVGSQPKA